MRQANRGTTGTGSPSVGWLALAILICGGGCAPQTPPLPTYPAMDEQSALRTLADRAAAVRSVAGACGLTLTRSDGQAVQLDGAMVMAPPDRLRLQAFKFGRTVFDLTLNPDGLWVKTAEDPEHRAQVVPASLSAGQFVREWSWFNGGFFTSPGLESRLELDPPPHLLIVEKSLPDGRRIRCIVDRSTLTPRLYELTELGGKTRFQLTLTDYRPFGQVVWPMKLQAASDGGKIEIEMRDVEINGDLPPRAFVPPPGAEKR